MTPEQVVALLALLADQQLQIGRLKAENETLRQAVVAAQPVLNGHVPEPEMAQ